MYQVFRWVVASRWVDGVVGLMVLGAGRGIRLGGLLFFHVSLHPSPSLSSRCETIRFTLHSWPSAYNTQPPQSNRTLHTRTHHYKSSTYNSRLYPSTHTSTTPLPSTPTTHHAQAQSPQPPPSPPQHPPQDLLAQSRRSRSRSRKTSLRLRGPLRR